MRVSQATRFSTGCLPIQTGTTVYANAEVEPHLAIDPLNPNHLVAAWQQDRLSDGGARGLVSAVSVDGGATWSEPRALAFSQCAAGTYARVSDPWVGLSTGVAFHAGIAFTGGRFQAGARSAVVVSRSGDGGFNWGAPVALTNDDGSEYFNDKESLTTGPTDSRYVYAVWDRLDTDDRGPTRFARSQDGGLSWEPAVTIFDPGSGAQTIGNVVVARMPSFLVADDLAAGRLKCLFADWTPRAEGIYACYPHRHHLAAKVKAAVEFFQEAWGPKPSWDEVLSSAQCQC